MKRNQWLHGCGDDTGPAMVRLIPSGGGVMRKYKGRGSPGRMGADWVEQILGGRGSSPFAPCKATMSWAGAALVSPVNLVEGCSA